MLVVSAAGRCDIYRTSRVCMTGFLLGPQPFICLHGESFKLQELFRIKKRIFYISVAIDLPDDLGIDEQSVGVTVQIRKFAARSQNIGRWAKRLAVQHVRIAKRKRQLLLIAWVLMVLPRINQSILLPLAESR